MQFLKPMLYEEALGKLGIKSPIGSKMLSTEWADVPVALRERAFFSSQVESARFLQRMKDLLSDFLSGATETLETGETVLKVGGRAQFVDLLSEEAISSGLGPLDSASAGGLRDITSEKRLGLIFNTQTRQADDYGYWRQGMDKDILNEFPAQRFIRVQAVKHERDSHLRFEDQVYLKTDPIWATTINEDFHVPWGPWGWGCGHDVSDIDRNEAESLDLIKPDDEMEPDRKNFNENLQASTSGLDPELLQKLTDEFGDKLEVDEVAGVLRWKSQGRNS